MEDMMAAEGGYFMRQHSLVAPYQGIFDEACSLCCHTRVYTQVAVWTFHSGSLVVRL